jgi:hypothetical protein
MKYSLRVFKKFLSNGTRFEEFKKILPKSWNMRPKDWEYVLKPQRMARENSEAKV